MKVIEEMKLYKKKKKKRLHLSTVLTGIPANIT